MKISVVPSALLALCLSMACATDADEKGKTAPSADNKLASSTPANVVDASPPTREAPIVHPSLGAHLDQADSDYRPRDYRPATLQGKTIELFLRSSPPGAAASMDGKAMGVTPTFWSGIADGQTHEFTFVKIGYAMARYRFVATQSGVVHGTLKPLVKVNEAEEAKTGTESPATAK